jgi:hypothetical protein
MKITINKEFTHVSKVSDVKKALVALKKTYNDCDMLSHFNIATDNNVSGKVLRCEISAYDNAFDFGASVELIVYREYYEFTTVRFYIDFNDNGTVTNVATDPLLITVDRYNRQF